ncbi:hypothetical protein [Salinibacter ruber]|uniref:hypothetical protein n=1 Tax=Salinibacter ruber TaxID=146919 RepID=UPI002168F053|nr:hypothetical protein [Salinibacter ruber]MCS4048364.1 hypothetical protein [Salinibacter ruber]
MDAFRTPTLSIFCLLPLALGVLVGCDSGGSGMDEGMDEGSVPDQISYDLAAQTDDGISGTVTFWRNGPNSSLVTVDLDAPDGQDLEKIFTGVSHPVHIHNNSVSDDENVGIVQDPFNGYLSAVNGRSANGTTARKIDVPIEDLASFNGHVNVHESPGNRNVLAQTDIGANENGTRGQGLNFVDDRRTTTYPLEASPTYGSVLSDVVSGTVRFEELTDSQTLVTYSLDTDGSVNSATSSTVEVAQIGHIHENTVENGGGIVSSPFSGYLGSIAPTDPAARSSRIINASFDDLATYPGYVNIHEAVADGRRGAFVQGNIGGNAGETRSNADVTITVDNVGNSAWEVAGVNVTNVSQGDVTQVGKENPNFAFEVGTRYGIVNSAGRSAHPFAVETGTDEDYLLRQESGQSGSLEDDSNINYVEDEEGVTFTYTQTLADRVAAYQCTFHGSMEGNVQTDGGGDSGGSGSGGY